MKKIVSLILISIIAFGALFALSACTVRKHEATFDGINYAASAKVAGQGDSLRKAVDGRRNSVAKLGEGDWIDLDFGRQVMFNTVTLREKGDNVVEFSLSVWQADKWEVIYIQDRILDYRVCMIEDTTSDKLRLTINASLDKVAIREIEVYYAESQNKDFRVSQYLRMDGTDMLEREGNPDFAGYYDVVTDVIIFDTIYFNADGTPKFIGGKENFDANFAALERIIGERDVRIWLTVFFDQYGADGKKDYDKTIKFLKDKERQYLASIQKLVDDYNLYGIDYDWEYPQKHKHWVAYGNIIQKTAKITEVSVAIAPWHGFNRKTRAAIHHINLMTYDIFDERSDHCNIYVGTLKSAAGLLNRGFSKEQIYLGLPFYGRTVNRSEHAWPLYSDDFDLGKWGNFITDFAYDAKGVSEVSNAYLNGYAMIRDKTATAIAMDLGGVMIFRAACDMPYSYEYSLHRAIGEAVEQRTHNGE